MKKKKLFEQPNTFIDKRCSYSFLEFLYRKYFYSNNVCTNELFVIFFSSSRLFGRYVHKQDRNYASVRKQKSSRSVDEREEIF